MQERKKEDIFMNNTFSCTFYFAAEDLRAKNMLFSDRSKRKRGQK